MSETTGPNGSGRPDDLAGKAEKLAEDALEAGRKFVETDTGKKVADLADTAFDKADELRRRALESDLGRRAMDSEIGQQAADLAHQASDKARQAIPNALARNVAIGAAAGAVVALPIPFVGPILGAVVGAGLGYLRTITKKS